MVLAKDIMNSYGRIILRSGVEFTEREIYILKTWGITEAEVEEESCKSIEKPSAPNIAPERLEQVEKEMKRIFSRSNFDHPVMNELFRLCLQRRIKHEAKAENN